ncbi:hypothetical protein ABPG72_012974 [Tetrahymena utriculariae]
MKEPDILQEFKSLDNEKYEFSIYRDLVQRLKFDLQSNKVAIARFGGPIAICRDIVSTQFFENNDMFKEDIWFYSNEGLILNKIKFPYNQRIVGFDFIYEERLVVVLENGFYYLINSFEFDQNESKRIEEKRFNKPDEDLIVEAKVINILKQKNLVFIQFLHPDFRKWARIFHQKQQILHNEQFK